MATYCGPSITDSYTDKGKKGKYRMSIDKLFFRSTRLLACGVLASCLSLAQTIAMTDSERSVAQVVVFQADGSSKAFGTAFFVRDDGTLATVNHVYSEAISFMATTRGGTLGVRRTLRGSQTGIVTRVDLVSTDPLHDLAIVRLHDFSADAWQSVGGIRVATIFHGGELSNNSHLTFVGYFGDDVLPASLPATLSGTTILMVGQPPNVTPVEEFLISAFGVPGHSGSPVFLGDGGDVIGLMDSIVTVPVPFNPQPLHSGMNRVVKGEHLRSLLSGVR